MAANKNKRVPVKILNDILSNVNNVEDVYIPGSNNETMEVRRNITLKEALQFVSDIVGSCIDSDVYVPEALEISICVGVLNYYTNLTLPQNVAKQYDVIYNTGIYDEVVKHINMSQVEDIRKAAESKLKHQVTLISNGVIKKISDMSENIDDFLSTVSAMTDGIDGNALNSFIKNVAAVENVDELSLAKAVMKTQKEPASKKAADETSANEKVVHIHK